MSTVNVSLLGSMSGECTGYKVYKAGATTYLTSGELLHNDYSATVDFADGKTIYLKGLYKAKIKVARGDSGGVFYVKLEGKYYPLGITESVSKDGVYGCFVKDDEIMGAFDVAYY